MLNSWKNIALLFLHVRTFLPYSSYHNYAKCAAFWNSRIISFCAVRTVFGGVVVMVFRKLLPLIRAGRPGGGGGGGGGSTCLPLTLALGGTGVHQYRVKAQILIS